MDPRPEAPSSELSVSVVIPTHDRAAVVGRAVASALSEARAGDEVIVVDDGSQDDTQAVLAPFRARIRLVRVGHGGAGAARNTGVAAARNDLVAFLDSDDEWMPGHLELARGLLAARSDVLFSFANFGVRAAGREERRFLSRWHGDPRPWDEILGPGCPYSSLAALPEGCADFRVHAGSLYAAEARRAYVFTSTLVARRREAGDALHFAEDVPTREDLECFGRLARTGTAAHLDVETAWQYGDAGGRLSEVNALLAATSTLVILERVWGSDPAFIADHGELYRAAVEEQHRIRCNEYLHLGRVADARREIAQLSDPPQLYRALARLPGPLLRGALRLRRGLGLERLGAPPFSGT